MRRTIEDIFEQGRAARTKGKARATCPFSPRDEYYEANAWLRGWDRVELEKRWKLRSKPSPRLPQL